MKKAVSAERIRELLHYDAETGHFTWVQDRAHNAGAGSRAGTQVKNGAIHIGVDGRVYLLIDWCGCGCLEQQRLELWITSMAFDQIIGNYILDVGCKPDKRSCTGFCNAAYADRRSAS